MRVAYFDKKEAMLCRGSLKLVLSFVDMSCKATGASGEVVYVDDVNNKGDQMRMRLTVLYAQLQETPWTLPSPFGATAVKRESVTSMAPETHSGQVSTTLPLMGPTPL